MTIGFIGFGEASSCIASGLLEEGCTGMVAFDAMANQEKAGALVRERAQSLSVALLPGPGDVAAQSDLLFVAVPSAYALDACQSVLDALQEGQLYVELSSSPPETKRQIWETVSPRGVKFIDATMLGSLPQLRHKVPIMASGNGARALIERTSALGMDITYVSEEPGSAAAIKLVRSVFMKGLAALIVETLQGAQAYGISDEIIASLSGSLDGIPFAQHVERLVSGTAVHAARRGHELEGSLDMLAAKDIDSAMAAAAKHKHELLSQHEFGPKPTCQQVIQILNQKQ